MNGAITLNSDSKISHNWNLFTLNGPITAASGSNNLEMAITVSGQATLAVGLGGSQGFVKSGAGTLVLSGGTANTMGGTIVLTNGTIQTPNGASLPYLNSLPLLTD